MRAYQQCTLLGMAEPLIEELQKKSITPSYVYELSSSSVALDDQVGGPSWFSYFYRYTGFQNAIGHYALQLKEPFCWQSPNEHKQAKSQEDKNTRTQRDTFSQQMHSFSLYEVR